MRIQKQILSSRSESRGAAALLAVLLRCLALSKYTHTELTFCFSVVRAGRKALSSGGPTRESVWAAQARCPGETPGGPRETEKHRQGRLYKTSWTIQPMISCLVFQKAVIIIEKTLPIPHLILFIFANNLMKH